jgi:hypothetical protein
MFLGRFSPSRLGGERKPQPVSQASGPTSQIVLCMLPLIQSGKVGLAVTAAAADVIAADARLNLWALSIKTRGGEPRKLDDEGWLRMLELGEEVLKECQVAVQRFSQDDDHRELADRLQRAAVKLNRIPKLVLPAFRPRA